MSMKEAFLAELKYEAGNTRKLLEAMTDESLGYKPDHKNWAWRN